MDAPTTNDVVTRLRDWTRKIEDERPEPEPAVSLMEDAASEMEAMRLEITRLRRLIDDYVRIAQSSSQEIYHLRHGIPLELADE